ncbi:MAG: hypothetical protein AAGF12_12655 [Myxococcota bacterium]
MPLSPHLADSEIGRDIGGLGLSVARNENPMVSLRAAQWRNALGRVGLYVPFWAAHDVGMMAVIDPDTIPIGARPGSFRLSGEDTEALEAWAETIREIGQTEVMEKARAWRLSDDLMAVLLLRILGPIYEQFRGPGRQPQVPVLPLDPEVYRDLEPSLPQLFLSGPREDDIRFLRFVAAYRLRLIIAVEQVDLDTLRLLGMFGVEAGAANALNMLDLLNVFQSPEANDVVNFSLDLLPSVLETKRASGQQTFAVDGYSGVERRGSIDSLVLSELAFDTDLFDKRYVENELFYYAHEKQHDEDRRLHYICVDASASMRGQRSVFARGLALTLVKKLMLRGEDVYLRFFDSRLYEVMHARPGRSEHGGISVPYVLCFRGERGRNYAKVFGMLANEIQRLARRERRTPILYIITHAECHVPLDTVERLRTLARLYGVFMLPSQGELTLDYLHRLHTVQVVDEAALRKKDERAQRALAIVEDVAKDEEDAAPNPAESDGRDSFVGRRSWIE